MDIDTDLPRPLISIIVRTLNRPNLLRKALRSLEEQTYPNLEVVVVNDGGDTLSGVLESFQDAWENLQLIEHSETKGRSAAANSGLEAARGEWVGFLDDDDVFKAKGLESLARYIAWDKQMIYGQVQVFHMEGEYFGDSWDNFASPFDPDRLLLENYIPICAYLCKREDALAAGGFDTEFELLEDWDFIYRLSHRAVFHYVPEIVSEYRIWGDAFLTGKNKEKEEYYGHLFFEKHTAGLSAERLQRAVQAVKLAAHRKRELCYQELTQYYQGKEQKALAEMHKMLRNECAEELKSVRGHIEELETEAVRRHRELDLLALQHRKLLEQSGEQELVWRGNVGSLLTRVSSAVPFDLSHIELERYGLVPLSRLFSGEDEQAVQLVDTFEYIEAPLVIFQQSISWVLEWKERSPAHVLSLRVATYSRINRCHLHLALHPLDEENQEGEAAARAVVDAVPFKDNHYAAFVLDCPLEKGRYRCHLHAPDADGDNAVALFVTLKENQDAVEELRFRVSPPQMELPDGKTYLAWYTRHRCSAENLEKQRRDVENWNNTPFISAIIPCYNSRLEWLEILLDSLLEQSNPHWECLLVEDASTRTAHLALIQKYCDKDKRFRLLRHEENQGVSAACQTGLDAAEGDYICVLDHDDWVEPQAFYEIAKTARSSEKLPDVLYSDEILSTEKGVVGRCEFRPDFNYYFLLSHPYIVHLTAVRRDIALQAGGFNPDLKVSQDYDLLLRVAALTRDFQHIPMLLYHWRNHETSTGHQQITKVTENSIAAIEQHLRATGFSEEQAWVEEGMVFNFYRVRYAAPKCKVSIIIPTRDRVDLLRVCIDSLVEKTRVPPGVEYEIIVVDNDSSDKNTLEYFDELGKAGHRVLPVPGAFNFSELNNKAVEQAEGEMLLFLNNDIEIVNEDWLEAMLELMARPEIGVVGAKLLYPGSGLVQHAGVLIGIWGVAAHDHQFYPDKLDGHPMHGHYYSMLVIRECMAVTAACMLVRREAFEKVSGFDEELRVGFGDTDLCLRIREEGYKCVFTPYASLIHHESASRGRYQKDPHPIDSSLFLQRWEEQVNAGDPFYNSNLVRDGKLYFPKM